MLGFVLIVTTVVALIHLYLWQRLIRDTTSRGRWRRVGGLAVLGAAVMLVTTMMLAGSLPPGYGMLAWPGYLWLVIMFYLLVALLALELPTLAASLILRRRTAAEPLAAQPVPEPELVAAARAGSSGAGFDAHAAAPTAPRRPGHDPGRRLFLRRGAAISAGLVATGVTGYGVSRAYAPPTIKELEVPLARLDPRADGLRVAVLADIHVGPLLGAAQVERMVELVNGLDADIVAVVGDMVSSEVNRVRESLLPLARMRARYGSYFVTGNHEYYVGHQQWYDAAAEMGLRVLRNERVEIAHGGGAIDLAGVNDIVGGQFDDPPNYAAALGARDQSRPVLLMAHQPVAVRDAAAYGVDLQLSGHTHGGQMYPFNYLVALEQPVVSGLAEVDGVQVYVTNGAGFWGPPARVGADPDITLITLRAP